MFAQHPQKAKRWAAETEDIKGLPEKLHPETTIPESERKKRKMTKKAADGMFFEKRSQPQKGHFFRDMHGRDDGAFHKKTAFTSYAPGQIPRGGGISVGSGSYGTGEGSSSTSPKTGKINVGATGAPVGGMGERGEGMSGGMYGAGDGEKDRKGGPSEAQRLAALLEQASEGKERKASGGEAKTAGKTPNDWDADSGLPTGFHRPAYEQPEALESGGERFHSTEAKSPNYGVGHGLVEGGRLRVPKGTGHQLGKHASTAPPRFLGTSFALQKTAMKYDPSYGEKGQDWASERAGEAGKSLRRAGRFAVSKADEGVKAITRSPAATAIAAMLLGRVGLRGLKGAGRFAMRGGRRAPAPQGLVSQAVGSIKKLVSGK